MGLKQLKSIIFLTISSIAKNLTVHDATRKQAVLLLIVRCFIVPAATGHTVCTTYLKMIRNSNKLDSYAWGAELLAFLYKGIGDCIVDHKSNLDGNGWLVIVSL